MLISQQRTSLIWFWFVFRCKYKNGWSRLWSFTLRLDLFYPAFCGTPREAEQRPALFCFGVNTPRPSCPHEQAQGLRHSKGFSPPQQSLSRSQLCVALGNADSQPNSSASLQLLNLTHRPQDPKQGHRGSCHSCIASLCNPPQKGESSAP